MWNRFRLWLNKNDSKIITVALCIIGFFIIIKGSNSVLRERFLEEKSKEESENTNSVFEDTELSKDNLKVQILLLKKLLELFIMQDQMKQYQQGKIL